MAASEQESEALVPEAAVARTYNSRGYDDPYRAVEDYREVMAFTEDHPDRGSTAIARRFDLPRGRVQPWLDGAQPSCVRGLDTATNHGWIDVDPRSPTFRGLNVLVAWVFSGGSIATDTWAPYFAIDDAEDRDLLDAAAGLVGVDLDVTRAPGEGHGQELRPTADGSVLGRVLVVLGAPRGEKGPDADLSLPTYLEGAPETVRQEFVQVYLGNRGQSEPTAVTTLVERRPTDYLESLADFIEAVTGSPVTVSGSNLVLSAEAASAVETWAPPLGVKA